MEILFALLVLLLVTKVCADAAVRVGQPALVGELTGGILLGAAVTLFPDTHFEIAEITKEKAFESLLDLAVFFLMLVAGLELRPKDLTGVTRRAMPIAISGMLLPLALGFAIGWVWLPESDWHFAQSLFLGVALAITAVPVAVKVLLDLNKLQTTIGRIVVAAAVIDDILSLLLLAVLTSVLTSSEPLTAQSFLWIVFKVGVFFAGAAAAGKYALPWFGTLIDKVAVEHSGFTLVVLFGLVASVLAELLGMHFLIGAFAAGVLFTRSAAGEEVYEDVRKQMEKITLGFLAPIFFASIGMHLDVQAATEIPLFVLVLLVAAIAGKFIGAGLVARMARLDARESLAVGAAMNARGAVEIIIADIALRAGLFDHPTPVPPSIEYLFSAIVIIALVTTLMTPLVLRALLGAPGSERSPDD